MPAPPMGADTAHSVILTSALIVGGAYAYRRLIESGGVPVSRPLPSFGRWATGYGLTFFALGVMADASPATAGWLAVLVATGTILLQGGQLAVDVNQRLDAKQKPQAKTPAVTNGKVPA